MNETMIVEGISLPVEKRSDASNADDRYQEDLLHARDSMEALRVAWGQPSVIMLAEKLKIESWQAWIQYLPHWLGKHYGITKDEIWAAWSNHHGPTVMLEALKKMPPEGC